MKIKLPDNSTVSALLDTPKKIRAALTLAHGAGAGMKHHFMEELSAALVAEGFAVLRFQFPYMEAGKKRTDSPTVATRTVAAAVDALSEQFPKIPLFAGGKSFGSRMTTTAAAGGMIPKVRGVICFGFPLHPAGEPDAKRAEHLAEVKVPTLFLQGTRDDLSDPKLMRQVCSRLKLAQLHEVQEADHGFDVLKRSGRTPAEVIAELAREAAVFAGKL